MKTRPLGDIEKAVGSEGAVGYGFRNESAICHDSAYGQSPALLYQTRRLYEEKRGKDREGAISVGRYLNLTIEAGIRPSILILNRGMHAATHADILEDVRQVMRRIRTSHPDALIIWRSTPCPHPWCMNYTRPIASPLPFEDLHLGHGTSSRGDLISYGWHPVCQQVPIMREMFEREWPGVVYLDATTPMALRPDTHSSSSDCVHYGNGRASEVAVRGLNSYHTRAQAPVIALLCFPCAAVDIWVQLLYNLLLLVDRLPPRTSDEAVGRLL